MKSTVFGAVSMAVLIAVSGGAAQAGHDSDYCDHYADKAVAQNEKNLAKGCGYGRDTRWHSRWEKHHAWCRMFQGTGYPAQEKATRHKMLHECH